MTETMCHVLSTNPTTFGCYASTDGRDRKHLGCVHASPREAIEHASAPRPDLVPATPASAFGATPNGPAGDAKARRGLGQAGVPNGSDASGSPVPHLPSQIPAVVPPAAGVHPSTANAAAHVAEAQPLELGL